jgi:hypothetical protein
MAFKEMLNIDFVVHEIGHQLGANHTFSYELEGTGVNVEPSGSTIMGYAGITSDYDVQAASDDYLHMPVFYKFKLILRQKRVL